MKRPFGAVVLPLIVILAFSIYLRWSSLNESLWIDEIHTAWIVGGELTEVAPRAMVGNQSPLVYYPFWAYIQLVGLSEASLRIPFLVAGLSTIALLYAVVWSWTRSLIAAITAALLLTLNDTYLYYSVESRIYAMVQLVALGHMLIFMQLLVRPNWKWRVAWILLGALLLHMHYTAGLLLMAEWVGYFALVVWGREDRPRYPMWQFFLDSALIVAALFPVLWHILAVAGRRDNWALATQQVFNPLTIFFIVPIAETALVAVIVWALLANLTNQKSADKPDGEVSDDALPSLSFRGKVILCVIWMLVPPVVAWSVNAGDIARVYMAKYVIVASVAPLILTGMIIALSPSLWQRLVIAAIVFAVLPLRNDDFRRVLIERLPAVDRQEDWRASIAELNHAIRENPLPVFLFSGFIESAALTDDGTTPQELIEFCLIPGTFPYRIEAPLGDLHPMLFQPPGKLLPSQSKIVAAQGAYFLVSNRPPEAFMREVGNSLKSSGHTGKLNWTEPKNRSVFWVQLQVE